MSKPSLRVYFVTHSIPAVPPEERASDETLEKATNARAIGAAGEVAEETRVTGRLMRAWDELFDKPAPAAFGVSESDVLEQLERQLVGLTATGESLTRYLWTEEFQTRRVRVDVHPLSSVKKRPVIGKELIPLQLTYAWSKMSGGAYRVMVPRFGGWFILEDLALAPDVLRHAVSSWLLGSNPRWVYDFRWEGEEWVREWSPALLTRTDVAEEKEDDAKKHPVLAQIGEELVELAARGKLPATVGDSSELVALEERLRKRPFPSLLVVGPPGVGKTTFVRRLARHFAQKRSDAKKKGGLAPPRIWSTSGEKIIAGMVYLGMWQERCLRIVAELAEDSDYLYVDRLTSILRAQPDGGTIADALTPSVVSEEISLIAECTESELEWAKRRAPALLRRFTIVRLSETVPTATIELLHLHAAKKGAAIHPAGLHRLVQHLAAFARDSAFPGKGFRFIDWLTRQRKADREGAPRLYPRDVSEAFARYSGVSLDLVADERPASAAHFATRLRDGVVGQDHACSACARALARLKAGLDDPERPCGTFLFVGPTGVGKTELAKQFARVAFGEDRLIRFDMSEYGLRGSGQRLLDSSPGVTSLAQLVRQQPLSLVLFDEVEKASPDVFDLLLSVLGEGRLTDSSGRIVDFRGTFIVMTSNLGVSSRAPVGFGDAPAPDFARAVRAHFRPELFNRIDDVLSFRALTREDVIAIVDLELAKLAQRTGLLRRGLRLRVSSEAKSLLAELGYHPTFGARPLKRLLEERIMTRLAAEMAADAKFREREVKVVAEGEEAGSGFVVRITRPE